MSVRATVMMAAAVLALSACSGSSDSSTDRWTQVSPQQLNQMLRGGDVFLVNVHVPYEGEIPGTDAFIPYTKIKSRAGELPDDGSTVVLYCRSGRMSTEAAEQLAAVGVSGFSELEGGFDAWRAADLPFEPASP